MAYFLSFIILCTPLLNKILFYSPNLDSTSVHCSTSVYGSTSVHCITFVHGSTFIHTPCWWDFSHSNAATRLLRRWDFLHYESVLHWWIFPTRRTVSVRPADEISPVRDINAGMPTGSFSAILRESKLSVDGIAPTRSPLLWCRDFSLSAFVWCSTDRIISTRSTNTGLRASLIWTYERLNPRQFSSVWFLPYLDTGNTPTLELPYSIMGLPPLERQLRCGIFPTWMSTPLWGLLPLSGTGSSHQVGAPTWKVTLNLSLGDIPTSGYFY